MVRMVVCCLFFLSVLAFMSVAMPAELPRGTPAVQCGASGSGAVPLAVQCGYGRSCQDGYSCCNTGKGTIVCCRDGQQHYCPSNNTCYSSYQDASAACGSSWTVCYKPAK